MEPLKKKDVSDEDGLILKGPLTGGITTMKVGVRPPDIPLIDRIEGLVRDLERSKGHFPEGSSLSVRTIDGFVQISDLSAKRIDPERTLRIIEYDPVRMVFLAGGDGDADIRSEISWYILKAVPALSSVLFIPDESTKSDIPENVRKRTELMLEIAKKARDGRMVSVLGQTVIGLKRPDDILRLEILHGKEDGDHSKSQ